jgi:hypothetical protein
MVGLSTASSSASQALLAPEIFQLSFDRSAFGRRFTIAAFAKFTEAESVASATAAITRSLLDAFKSVSAGILSSTVSASSGIYVSYGQIVDTVIAEGLRAHGFDACRGLSVMVNWAVARSSETL